MDGQKRDRGRERGARQTQPLGDDQGSAIESTQGQGHVDGDRVVTAINRMTDILERLVEQEDQGPINQPRA